MTIPRIESYEIKRSRSENLIPIINGVHLHSAYNPVKEADAFVTKNEAVLAEKNEILIFGLGFAYHVNALAKQLKRYHPDGHKVVVIEPSLETYNHCMHNNLLEDSNIIIYSGVQISELYQDLNLTKFLLNKPGVIAHTASFNLYIKYFKSFLAYKAPRNVEKILERIRDPYIEEYLRSFGATDTVEDIFATIKEKKKKNSQDFLALAFEAMTRKTTIVDNRRNS